MAKRLRACAGLTEDLSLVSSDHTEWLLATCNSGACKSDARLASEGT